jgi:hypothetical protein
VQAGAFEAATKFGLEVGVEKYPFLLKSAYYQWAQRQPEAAYASIEAIKDPLARSQAYDQTITGWARADAKAVAEYALKLPPGDQRNRAFAEALPRWVEADPAAATEWINNFDSGADFDDGVSAVANMQTLITRQPSKAMEWAASIHDSKKRSETLRTVFRQWAERDLAAARNFINNTPNEQDRHLLTSELKDLHPDA